MKMIGENLSSRTQIALALVGGSLTMILSMSRLLRQTTIRRLGPWAPWMAGGSILLLAIPIYLLLRYSLVLPLLSAILMTGNVLWRDYTAIVDSPAPLFFGWWFVPLAIALVLGMVEYLVRGTIM